MNLEFSDSREIESAYIIRLSNNEVSAELAQRCKQSCDQVRMQAKYWEGFDGTSGSSIITPEHLLDKDYFNWIKVHDNRITTSQIAALLSHFSLWCHCLTIDKPIVILEHDAIMIKSLNIFDFFNAIQYLGNSDLLNGAPYYIIPPFGTAYNKRLKFICRAHAYAVDPAVCKHLISRLIANGIFVNTTADMFMRADIFNIVQNGLYAYDAADWDRSTIEEKESY